MSAHGNERPGSVYVSWKRGSKAENAGATEQAPIDEATRVALFPSKPFDITSTVIREANDKYESKPLAISLIHVHKKKESAVGKAVFDLAEHIPSMGQGTGRTPYEHTHTRCIYLEFSLSPATCTQQEPRRLAFR